MKNVIRRKPYLIPLFIIIAAAAIGLFGWLVMTLWNITLVPATGASVITFWQGLGLLVLSRILVGGFGGRRQPRTAAQSGHAHQPRARLLGGRSGGGLAAFDRRAHHCPMPGADQCPARQF